MSPIVRRMIVYRAPCTNDSPMIRIANKMLADMGFKVGTRIEVSYAKGIITIKKINHENRLLPKALPLTDSDGGEEDGH